MHELGSHGVIWYHACSCGSTSPSSSVTPSTAWSCSPRRSQSLGTPASTSMRRCSRATATASSTTSATACAATLCHLVSTSCLLVRAEWSVMCQAMQLGLARAMLCQWCGSTCSLLCTLDGYIPCVCDTAVEINAAGLARAHVLWCDVLVVVPQICSHEALTSSLSTSSSILTSRRTLRLTFTEWAAQVVSDTWAWPST